MATSSVPVLIVGSGPVGLCISLLLSRHGVTSRLVERHPGLSIHARARGLLVRSLELFRTWGLEAAVREAGSALDGATGVVWAESLAGPERRRVPAGSRREDVREVSPTTPCACTQVELEPVLLATYEAERLPVMRFVTEQALAILRRPGLPEQYATRGLALGVSYDSAAVIADGTPAPEVANPVLDYESTPRGESRAACLPGARRRAPLDARSVPHGLYPLDHFQRPRLL